MLLTVTLGYLSDHYLAYWWVLVWQNVKYSKHIVLFLCSSVVHTTWRFMFGLVLLFVYVFLLSFKHSDHLAWGRVSWSLYLSCICLLAMHTLICVTFSLPPGVGGWLRLLLVALPGLFCLPFFNTISFQESLFRLPLNGCKSFRTLVVSYPCLFLPSLVDSYPHVRWYIP